MTRQRLAIIATVATLVAGQLVSSASGSGAAGSPRTRPRDTGATVTLVDFAYQAPEITVVAGTTVTWTDQGFAPHSVTSDTGAFDSGPNCPAACLANGDTFQHTFDQPGTFAYHCRIHGGAGGVGMAGRIVVIESPTTTPPTTTPPTTGPTTTTPATDPPSSAPPTSAPGSPTTGAPSGGSTSGGPGPAGGSVTPSPAAAAVSASPTLVG